MDRMCFCVCWEEGRSKNNNFLLTRTWHLCHVREKSIVQTCYDEKSTRTDIQQSRLEEKRRPCIKGQTDRSERFDTTRIWNMHLHGKQWMNGKTSSIEWERLQTPNVTREDRRDLHSKAIIQLIFDVKTWTQSDMTLSTIEAVYRSSDNLGDSNMTAGERSSFSFQWTPSHVVAMSVVSVRWLKIFFAHFRLVNLFSPLLPFPLYLSIHQRQDALVLIYWLSPSPISFTLSISSLYMCRKYILLSSTHSHPLHHQAWLVFSYFPKECTHFDHLFAQILGNERLPSREKDDESKMINIHDENWGW